MILQASAIPSPKVAAAVVRGNGGAVGMQLMVPRFSLLDLLLDVTQDTCGGWIGVG